MTTPLCFNHEMLVANAGSGKTYTLTTRIIRLLLAGVSMDKIAALTFTRKSAGEFLDELLIRLAEAASHPEKLSALADSCEQPDLTAEQCCQILRHIIEHFGRLGLSTIDSFFARIARQFPLESGLPEEFVIADSTSLASARERALARSFALGVSGDSALEAMIEQCRQISRKNGERNVFGMLLKEIETLHQRYLETPDGCIWGDAKAIWPQGLPFAGVADLSTAIIAFGEAARSANPALSEQALAKLDEGLEALQNLDPGQVWSKEVQTFIEQKLSSEPKNNHIRFGSKKADGWVELTSEVQASRKILRDALFADVIQQFLERSQGLYQFVQQYESVYSELIRNAGLISFSDITQLLAERASEANDLDALDWRTQVAYRIDQNFDHWLLDEFQDTSRTQWSILRAFVDEVLMDDAAQRSFFYVGDTKQAIYGWRGGDAELFREIYEHYQTAIKEAAPLIQSWRSTEPVIELVNQVFGMIEPIADTLELPEETVQKWTLGWNQHEVAEPIRDRVGYAAWHAVNEDPDDDTPAQHREVLRILQEVEPLKHDIECAVLLRQNKQVAQLAALLQSIGIPVAVEGKTNPCTDNLLGSAVLAALRAVAHPADTLSAIIAQGFSADLRWNLEDMEAFRGETLQSIAEHGYAKTLQGWVELANFNENEAFLASRADALLAAAEAFDAKVGSSEGIDAFIAAIEAAETQEAEAKGVIRIMTVHQAKGLGFDMVIACGLDDSGRSQTSDELILGPDKRNAQWAILLPRKNIAEADPIMRRQVERIQSEAKTNELCSAYVALTRAKQALYVISNELKEKTSATHFGRHLALSLDKAWSEGDSSWYNR